MQTFSMPEQLEAHFPLNAIAGGLEDFQPPEGPFDPSAGWEQAYGVYTLTRGCHRAGMLRLRRERTDGANARLEGHYEKVFPGGHCMRVAGVLDCRTDARATPVAWRWRSEMLRPDGKAVEGTVLEKTGRAEPGAMHISDPGGTRRVALDSAPTLHWSLFDAVQRLPREAFEPLRFTLIDHFDQPKPEQRLAFRKTCEVMLGGQRVQRHEWTTLEKGRVRRTSWACEGARPVRLYAYDHLGWGIVPWVYWVSGAGRLLFVVAGLEAYIIESSTGNTANE